MAAFSLDDDTSGTSGGAGNDSSVDNTLGADTFAGTDRELNAANGGDSGGGDNFTFDPERHISRDKRNADGSYRNKRRRKSGGSGPSASNQRGKTQASHSASVEFLGNTLLIVHVGLAKFTKIDELEIDDAESSVLAKAVDNVMSHFDIAPDPKVQAIVGLITVCAGIYGPRFYLYNERMKKAARKPATIHVINPGAAPSEFKPGNEYNPGAAFNPDNSPFTG